MADNPNRADFLVDTREGEWEATFRLSGTVYEKIRAGSRAEALALADEMIEGDRLELTASECDDVALDDIRPAPPMYLALRDGKEISTTHLRPGDKPRPANKYELAKGIGVSTEAAQ